MILAGAKSCSTLNTTLILVFKTRLYLGSIYKIYFLYIYRFYVCQIMKYTQYIEFVMFIICRSLYNKNITVLTEYFYKCQIEKKL